MVMLVITCMAFPITIFFGGLVWGEGLTDAVMSFWDAVLFGIPYGMGFTLFGLLIALLPRFSYFKLQGVVPTRFNRQRREVCLVPSDSDDPVFVLWEDIQAWDIQAQGATQYGVQRWSVPLPESERAQPSDTLKRLSRKVREKQQARPGRLPHEVFAEVYGFNLRAGM